MRHAGDKIIQSSISVTNVESLLFVFRLFHAPCCFSDTLVYTRILFCGCSGCELTENIYSRSSSFRLPISPHVQSAYDRINAKTICVSSFVNIINSWETLFDGVLKFVLMCWVKKFSFSFCCRTPVRKEDFVKTLSWIFRQRVFLMFLKFIN